MMYRVTWEIDIEADQPDEAAKKALAIMRDPESTATVFDVWGHMGGPVYSKTTIDLSE